MTFHIARSTAVSVAFALAALSAHAAGGQAPQMPQAPLPLGEALRLADKSAFPNRAAAGATTAQRGQALGAMRGILPSVRFDAGYVRTTDPVGTFGSTLRQRIATAADFDPARLNHPDAVGNFQTGIVVEQPLFNADAWLGRRAALHAEDATVAQQDWTRLSTHTDVIRAHYGAVLAGERVVTLEAATAAAKGHVRQAEAMVRNGVATKSDALLASVRMDELDAQLAEARGAAQSARRQLEVALGQDPSGTVALPRSLPSSDRIRQLAASDSMSEQPGARSDVEAAHSAVVASQADLLRARSAYLPRINGFARYDWNSAASLYAGDKNWTVGVMASWAPFAGASEIADGQSASGREASARAQADGAVARARLEVEQTRTALTVALTRLDIAERAVAQSAEAHRMVARKYESGLATVAELLDAQATEVRAARSRYRKAATPPLSRALNAGRLSGATRRRLQRSTIPLPR